MSADFSCPPSVFLIEFKHWKLESVHAGYVLLDAPALERAVVQFVVTPSSRFVPDGDGYSTDKKNAFIAAA